MDLTSPAFENNGTIPKKYTCEGDNISPPLKIEFVPDEAESLVLIMEDPDVPEEIRQDKMFDHWVLFNIDPSIKEIEENSAPGIHGKNTAGGIEYTGPCPPKDFKPSEHRYIFSLYALDVELSIPEGCSKKSLLDAIRGHIVGETQLTGKYEKE